MLRFLLPALLATTAFAQDYYCAALDGAQQNPPIVSPGSGWAVVRHDPATNQVRIFAFFENTAGAITISHLHQAPPGANGGPVLPLTLTANTGVATSTISPAQAAALAAGNTYLNFHSTAFPGGELRGQVVPSVSTRFTGLLDGAQQNPPVATAATGTAVAFLHEPANRVIYMVDTQGIGTVTAAHFHLGVAGTNGSVLAPLNGSGTYCGVTERLTAAQVTAWNANGVYVNVHSAANPGGELRAQMLKDAGDHFVAEPSQSQIVPPTGSPGLGGVSIVVGPGGSVTCTGAVAGLVGTVTSAHMHRAPAGTNGGAMFPLVVSGNTFSATFTPTTTQLADLRLGLWYVNVHSTTNPGGEIRGQFGPAKLPTSYGGGCTGSNGIVPAIGATSFASIGSSMSIDLYGAVPTSFAVFGFGASRDLFGAASALPLELTLVGINAPNCFLLVDPSILLVATTDAFGCASQPINLPSTPSLRGSQHYCQWFLLDLAANPGGFVASNALEFVVQ